jgi:hypothetical protein
MRKNKFKESTKGLGYVETILDYIDQMLYSQIHKNNKKILLQYKNKIKLFLKRFSHTKDID